MSMYIAVLFNTSYDIYIYIKRFTMYTAGCECNALHIDYVSTAALIYIDCPLRPSRKEYGYQMIMDGKLVQLLASWKVLGYATTPMIDLLSRMLTKEDRRMTMEDILSHEWLQEEKGTKNGRMKWPGHVSATSATQPQMSLSK